VEVSDFPFDKMATKRLHEAVHLIQLPYSLWEV